MGSPLCKQHNPCISSGCWWCISVSNTSLPWILLMFEMTRVISNWFLFVLFFNMTVGSLLSNGHCQSKEDFGMWCNTRIHIMSVQLSNLQQLWCHINVDQNLRNVSAPCWVYAAKNYSNYAGNRGTSSFYPIMWLLTVDEWLESSPNFMLPD